MIKKFLIITALWCISPYICAEYFIIKPNKENKNFSKLDDIDAINFAKIHTILLDYQWPSNLAQAKPLPSNHPVFLQQDAAEENFLRDRIHKEVGYEYDIVFIPTTMYELFMLKEIYTIANMSIEEIDKDWKALYQTYQTILKESFNLDTQIETVIENSKKSMADVFTIYRALNTNSNGYIEQAHFFINNRLVEFLIGSRLFLVTDNPSQLLEKRVP